MISGAQRPGAEAVTIQSVRAARLGGPNRDTGSPTVTRVAGARTAFVHQAELLLGGDVDPAACGAAVTAALCGHWEHDGPCRWPHNNEIDVGAVPALFRTLFVAESADEETIRARIDEALAARQGWSVRSSGSRPVAADEQELAGRLLSGPHAG